MKLLYNGNLKTSSGENVQIITSGEHNTDAGPDFLNAKIRIGETLWAGNVEIHLKSSDWNLHNHQSDKAYDNIILHVVFEHDHTINRADGSSIPCLEIKNHFDPGLYNTYQTLMQSVSRIPCGHHLPGVEKIIISNWLHRLMIERMEEKVQSILSALEENHHNWEETFYQFLAQAFGAKVNSAPFRILARLLPVKILAKHKNNLFQLEALLFGMAGFLDEKFSDDYPNQLKKEFTFLRKKLALQPLKKHLWKFLRLRPANFPTIRLAQFATLIYKSSHLFSKILETEDVKSIAAFFDVEASAYWVDHYRFDKTSGKRKKTFGSTATDLLLINTIAPFLFVYGKLRGEEIFITRSIGLLENISAEKNNIINGWQELGITANSAFETQALLQLRNNYCKNYRCLDCAIGHKVLLASPPLS
jgi:hypothetical protein